MEKNLWMCYCLRESQHKIKHPIKETKSINISNETIAYVVWLIVAIE